VVKKVFRPGSSNRTHWHAVSILRGRFSCHAAQMVGEQRFLDSDAPRLPLAGCSAPDACQCKYKHHQERRGLPRRREERIGLRQQRHTGPERRVSPSRRQPDPEDGE
jgi:hypothetical protein